MIEPIGHAGRESDGHYHVEQADLRSIAANRLPITSVLGRGLLFRAVTNTSTKPNLGDRWRFPEQTLTRILLASEQSSQGCNAHEPLSQAFSREARVGTPWMLRKIPQRGDFLPLGAIAKHPASDIEQPIANGADGRVGLV